MDSIVMALYKHLGNTGSTTKVSIDLKRRMCIK